MRLKSEPVPLLWRLARALGQPRNLSIACIKKALFFALVLLLEGFSHGSSSSLPLRCAHYVAPCGGGFCESGNRHAAIGGCKTRTDRSPIVRQRSAISSGSRLRFVHLHTSHQQKWTLIISTYQTSSSKTPDELR